MRFTRSLSRLLTVVLASMPCAAAAPAAVLADYSLEQLSEIVVGPVTRQDTGLAATPVTIRRIGHQDILRSGATTLPEALWLATSLHVARASAVAYTVAARGFFTAPPAANSACIR